MSDQQHCINCLRETQGFYPYPCQQCGWSPDQQSESGLYLSPGTILHNQYQIARMLGHGGFGITYLAWDTNLETKLAIKEYMPRDFATRNSTNAEVSTYAGDAKENFAYGLERFLEEARTLAKFNQHTGIVSVLNFFKANGTGYMVMEYVDGFTLKDYLINKGNLSWMQTRNLFMPVMDALREVHKYGMLHRDISPDNIYLCRDKRIKLLDFGSARYALGGHSRSLSVVVKPGYAPEEQYRAKGKQGPWTDVYSVAASMYRCITGVVPPDALDRLDKDELVRPSELGAEIPAEAEQALMGALAVKAENRIQSIEDFQQALLKNRTATSNREKPIPVPTESVKPSAAYTEEALDYFNQKNYDKALGLFQYAAAQGDARAQNYLGWMYHNGRGVQQDDQQAVQWYRKAADQGDADAQTKMEQLCKTPPVIEENRLDKLYKAAIGEGADYYLDVFKQFDANGGFTASTNWAAFLFGPLWLLSRSMLLYGVLFFLLYLFTPYLSIAYNFILYMYGNALYYRHIRKKINKVTAVYPDDLPSQIYRLKNIGAYGGMILSFIALGSIFIYLGNYTDQQTPVEEGIKFYNEGSYEKALNVFRPAAEQGNARAQDYLGILYASGQGVQQDYQQALKWYRKAAEQGEAFGQYSLGWMYEKGLGVKQDYQQAVHWIQKAADQGLADAQYNLGVMYENGDGVQQDDQEAVQWYRKAAEQGNANAIKTLKGIREEVQQGVKGDVTKQVKSAGYKLGDRLPDGGIVFYIDASGKHGLAAKPADEANQLDWNAAMAAASAYGSGWHLPTMAELDLLYKQQRVVGGFASGNYWSSKEYYSNDAWYQDFYDDYRSAIPKTTTRRVRAVRAFYLFNPLTLFLSAGVGRFYF